MEKKQNALITKNIILAGNPNVGKSTVFNRLTGSNQHTGNWTGKTVALCSGSFINGGVKYNITDLPGTYSLSSESPDEAIARDYIVSHCGDTVIIVADAVSLERNLMLVMQIKEVCRNIILAVNLLDEAERRGIKIDIEKLSGLLDICVIGITAARKNGIRPLTDALSGEKYLDRNKTDILYPIDIERALDTLTPVTHSRYTALRILDGTLPHDNAAGLSRARGKLIEGDIRTRYMDSLAAHSKSISGAVISGLTPPSFRADKILTSRALGIPVMIGFLSVIIFLTLIGANFFSGRLSLFFGFLENRLLSLCTYLKFPGWLSGSLITGVFRTLGWVIAVMLPPMAIFFPLFTYLEDLGYLPRMAFNLDRAFHKCGTGGKQSLTMCMGLGCNACGVVGARIIRSPRERLIAIITNCFIPCNGRFPLYITISSVFFGRLLGGFSGMLVSALIVSGIIILGIVLTFIVSKILSVTVLKGAAGEFALEIPPFRRPSLLNVAKVSVKKIASLLLRAIIVAAPGGLIIWLFSNVYISGANIMTAVSGFLNPAAKFFGLDGIILLAFFLALPANEIVLPVIITGYLASGGLIEISDYSVLYDLFITNGWTVITAVNIMLFSLMHFPCGTTLLTIRKETGSLKWTAAAFLIPLFIGLAVCAFTNGIYLLCTL